MVRPRRQSQAGLRGVPWKAAKEAGNRAHCGTVQSKYLSGWPVKRLRSSRSKGKQWPRSHASLTNRFSPPGSAPSWHSRKTSPCLALPCPHALLHEHGTHSDGPEMTTVTTGQTSIWVAALLAADCSATEDGESWPIQWEYSTHSARYTATHSVTVRPFGIVLTPGQILEVHWRPGDTAYSFVVEESGKPERRPHGRLRHESAEPI